MNWYRKVTPRERQEWFLAFCLLSPAILMLSIFVLYPFSKGLWLSVLNTEVAIPGEFIGLKNFIKLWNDQIFRRTAQNTILYTSQQPS